MKKPRRRINPQICHVMLAIGVLGFGQAVADDLPFGGAADVQRAERLWPLLEERRLVGANAINTPLIEAREPVGRLIEVLGGSVSVDGTSRAAFVKRLYQDVPEDVIDADPLAALEHVVVMVQAEAGYNPAADDWFFVRYGPDGAVLAAPDGRAEAGRLHAGSDTGCMACHRAAPGDDFLFTTDRRR